MGLLRRLTHIPKGRFKIKAARFKGLGPVANRLALTAASGMFPSAAPFIGLASSFRTAHRGSHSMSAAAAASGITLPPILDPSTWGPGPGMTWGGSPISGDTTPPAAGGDDPLIPAFKKTLHFLHSKKRRMNWANSRALGRAERRLGSFVKHFTKTARFLGLHVGRRPKRSRRGAFGRKK